MPLPASREGRSWERTNEELANLLLAVKLNHPVLTLDAGVIIVPRQIDLELRRGHAAIFRPSDCHQRDRDVIRIQEILEKCQRNRTA